jgi:hypothetical protein
MTEESATPTRDKLSRVQAIATIFSLVAVPVIVALSGALIQRSIQSSEARSKSMELAITILKQAPANTEQPGLREWAIETLQASSPVKISEAARKELATKPLLGVQSIQRNISKVGFAYLKLNDPFNVSDEDPNDIDKEVTRHVLLAQHLNPDSALISVDGQPHTLYVNDSLLLPNDDCVIHLLGFGHSEGHDKQNSVKNNPPDINSAVIAYVFQ